MMHNATNTKIFPRNTDANYVVYNGLRTINSIHPSKILMGSNMYILPKSEYETYRSLRCISAMVFIYNLKRRHINNWQLKSHHLMLYSSFLQNDRKMKMKLKTIFNNKEQRIYTRDNYFEYLFFSQQLQQSVTNCKYR